MNSDATPTEQDSIITIKMTYTTDASHYLKRQAKYI